MQGGSTAYRRATCHQRTGSSQKNEPPRSSFPYPLATCIVSGDKIDPTVPAMVHNGQQVKFCCKACVKKFQAAPEKYLIKLPKR